MSAITSQSGAATKPAASRRPSSTLVLGVLSCFVVGAVIASAAIGAAGIPLSRLPAALGIVTAADPANLARDQLILWSIRLPRIAIAAMVGGMLGAAGAMMQGLFRNPLADPALVGVASGGALAAASMIILSDSQYLDGIRHLQPLLLPAAAFVGSLTTTVVLYRIASRNGRTSIALFLLAGIAIAAIANAGIGLLVFVSDDRQLRDITFWMLGSLSGATPVKAMVLLPVLTVALIAMAFVHRGLDLLILGESEAYHAGINVERLKLICILLISAMTGAAVSICGIVGFVGIIVPHLLRMVIGPGHRLLLPASVLLGAALLTGADTVARTIVAPAEMPLGILTAAVGAPVFLMILLRQRGLVSL